MKYEPKTTEWMRQNNWGAEAQQLVTDDLTSCESCLAEAERENLRLVECLKKSNANMEQMERGLYLQMDKLEQERDALREENIRLRKYIGVMDAALKIPDGASTTGERCKRTNSLIGSDDWMEEPACLCVVCANHTLLTPSGEAGKGGGA